MSRFPSVVNFRPILDNGEDDNLIPLYRSGRMDDITPDDFQRYKQLGIRTVLDLRDVEESSYGKSPGLILQNSSIANVVYPSHDYVEADEVDLDHLSNPTHQESSADSTVESRGNTRNDLGISSASRDDASPTSFYIFIPITNFHSAKYMISQPPRNVLGTWKLYTKLAWTRLLNSIWKQTGYIGISHEAMFTCDATQDVNLRVIASNCFATCCSRSFVAALKLLTKKESLPAVFCCNVGKDRTGVLAALILHILGKSEQTIDSEQMKCAEGCQKMVEMYSKIFPQRRSTIENVVSCKEGDLLGTWAYLKETYGSIDSYLDQYGFGADQRDSLRKNLLGGCE